MKYFINDYDDQEEDVLRSLIEENDLNNYDLIIELQDKLGVYYE
jgi:hypothetical protein